MKDTEDLKAMYEKFRLYYTLILECAKILPWELDTATMKIDNIFGMNVFFSENIIQIDFKQWLDMIYPEDQVQIRPYMNSIVEGRVDEISMEYRIKKDSGEGLWVKTIAKIRCRDASGKPSVIAGINQDITEAKTLEVQNLEREKKVRDNESRLKNAMKIGRMSSWEYDFKTGRIISNRQLAELWGFIESYDNGNPPTVEELGKAIYPEDRAYVLQKFAESVEKLVNFELIFRIIVINDIKHIHFASEIVFNDEGKPVKFVGIAQDISRMKRLENYLEKQYEGLKFIAEKAGLGLWELNRKESFIYTISGDEKRDDPDNIYKKISVSEFMHRIHPEDFTMFQSKLESHTYKSGDVNDFDIRLNVEKDQYRWYHVTAIPDRFDDSGIPVTYKGLYQDITERKEIEARLYQSQKMEAIGRLAGGIAHDFNNILQVILGYGSLALMDAENNSDMLENITHIVDSGEKAKSLVRQLLLFARKEKFRPVPVALNELGTGFISMLKRVIGENITLHFEPDKELQFIHGDTGQLEQVFMNLCINSRDAIDGSGTITIKTKNISIDEYWPCFDNRIPPGSYVVLSISDTGSGIPESSLSQIFEPFYTTKEKNRGTGLGLATVYSIVKQHRGYIDVRTVEARGTSFSIYFPVYGEEKNGSISEEKDNPVKKHSGSGTVLIAEDDDLIRKYTKRILEDSGYKVLIAEDGQMAVDLYNSNKDIIDLLIFDVIMPKKTGWDVYREIGGIENRIPVVFFSGYDQNLLPANAAEIIPMVYVQKPFKYYTIIKAIHDLLDGRTK